MRCFFFAPAQIGKRNKDWGPGVLMQRAYAAGAQQNAKFGRNLEKYEVYGVM